MNKSNHLLLGIILMVFGIFFFTVTDIGLKWFVTKYPTGEVFFLRCIFSLIPILIFTFYEGGLKNLITYRPFDHLRRAIVDSISLLAIIIAFAFSPMLDAMAVAFTAPIMVMGLSVPLLGEKVGVNRWMAAFVGFIGALLIIKPGVSFNVGTIYALISAFFLALALIMTRQMSWTESTSAIVFWSAVCWVVMSSIFLPFVWVTPTFEDWIGFIFTGISGGVAQIAITYSLRLVSPNTVAPYKYTSLIWAAVFGYLIWGDIPDLMIISGVLLIVCSGLFILYRESVSVKKNIPVVDTGKVNPPF